MFYVWKNGWPHNCQQFLVCWCHHVQNREFVLHTRLFYLWTNCAFTTIRRRVCATHSFSSVLNVKICNLLAHGQMQWLSMAYLLLYILPLQRHNFINDSPAVRSSSFFSFLSLTKMHFAWLFVQFIIAFCVLCLHISELSRIVVVVFYCHFNTIEKTCVRTGNSNYLRFNHDVLISVQIHILTENTQIDN